ncbi:MAG: hypothetical protein CMI16_13225 [Opitutaceae bacterium]|nr:hypothetical protein [Opitutaceae bacterium]
MNRRLVDALDLGTDEIFQEKVDARIRARILKTKNEGTEPLLRWWVALLIAGALAAVHLLLLYVGWTTKTEWDKDGDEDLASDRYKGWDARCEEVHDDRLIRRPVSALGGALFWVAGLSVLGTALSKKKHYLVVNTMWLPWLTSVALWLRGWTVVVLHATLYPTAFLVDQWLLMCNVVIMLGTAGHRLRSLVDGHEKPSAVLVYGLGTLGGCLLSLVVCALLSEFWIAFVQLNTVVVMLALFVAGEAARRVYNNDAANAFVFGLLSAIAAFVSVAMDTAEKNCEHRRDSVLQPTFVIYASTATFVCAFYALHARSKFPDAEELAAAAERTLVRMKQERASLMRQNSTLTDESARKSADLAVSEEIRATVEQRMLAQRKTLEKLERQEVLLSSERDRLLKDQAATTEELMREVKEQMEADKRKLQALQGKQNKAAVDRRLAALRGAAGDRDALQRLEAVAVRYSVARNGNDLLPRAELASGAPLHMILEFPKLQMN